MLDKLKDLGFKYSTISGITVSASDMNVYSKKDKRIVEAEAKIQELEEFLMMVS